MPHERVAGAIVPANLQILKFLFRLCHFGYSPVVFGKWWLMSNNMTESGRKAAALKVEKRAAALRENLKRRKTSEAARINADKEEKDEKTKSKKGIFQQIHAANIRMLISLFAPHFIKKVI